MSIKASPNSATAEARGVAASQYEIVIETSGCTKRSYIRLAQITNTQLCTEEEQHTGTPTVPRSSGSCSEALLPGYHAEKSAMRLKLPVNFVRSKSCPILTHLAKLTSLR